MKHSVKITTILVLFFFITQITGLLLISASAQKETVIKNGQSITTVNYTETALGERPQFETDYGPLIYLVVGVFIGTLIIFLLMKIKMGGKLWKYWYLTAIVFSMTIALGVFMNALAAFLISLILGIIKIKKPGYFWIHNLTEILMYAGLAVLFAPMFNVTWAIILLLLISIYDAYAVWKSKHMVKLAKFTMKNKLFAGLYIPYIQQKNKTRILLKNNSSQADLKVKNQEPDIEKIPKPKHENTVRQAILGGGDVVFPLIFSGTVFTNLLQKGFNPITAFVTTGIIIVTTTLSLYILFYAGKKNKFYPAMPFITLGALTGYGLIQLVLLLF